MLSESPATTSRDLNVAAAVEVVPELAKAETKGAAFPPCQGKDMVYTFGLKRIDIKISDLIML